MNAPAAKLQVPERVAHKPSKGLARVLSRMPEALRDSLTAAQLAAIDDALDGNYPDRPSVDLRVTFFDRAYIAVIGGRERRNPARRAEERVRHPLRTTGNIAFLSGVAVLGLVLGNGLHWLLFGG